MKAKEIVAKIRQRLNSGADAHEALADELVADVHRMRQQNDARKGQVAALLRLMKEYNQKWNSVIAQLNLMSEFQAEGQAYLQPDDFVRAVLHSVRDDSASIEGEKDLVLRPQSVTNMAIRLHQQGARAPAPAKVPKTSVSDPVLAYIKTTLGL